MGVRHPVTAFLFRSARLGEKNHSDSHGGNVCSLGLIRNRKHVKEAV